MPRGFEELHQLRVSTIENREWMRSIWASGNCIPISFQDFFQVVVHKIRNEIINDFFKLSHFVTENHKDTHIFNIVVEKCTFIWTIPNMKWNREIENFCIFVRFVKTGEMMISERYVPSNGVIRNTLRKSMKKHFSTWGFNSEKTGWFIMLEYAPIT